MADAGGDENAIKGVLEALSLERFYPEKMTSDDVYEITELSLQEKEHITPESISRVFINRLTRNNYTARNLKLCEDVSKKRPGGYLQRRKQGRIDKLTQFHPLDIMVALFVCCDPLAKQDLVMFMWRCKMSVPLILNDPSNNAVVYLWPLRGLITQWQEHGNTTTIEHSICKYPMQKIGFIRIGELDESKSALLNGIIGGPEKAHPMFFHRDMFGSQKRRSVLSECLVEIGWFLPKGVPSDRFSRSKLFANLRGDASKVTPQLDILLQTMDLILIISHTKYIMPNIATFSKIVNQGKMVLLILTDAQINDEGDNIIDHLVEQKENNDLHKFEILPLADKRLADKLDFICENIREREAEQESYASLEDIMSCPALELRIDEAINENIKLGMKYARHVSSGVDAVVRKGNKTDILPLQGELWKTWTETEAEIHKLDNFKRGDTKGDVLSYTHSLEKKKVHLRKQQFDLLKSLPSVMSYFIQCLSYLSPQKLKIVLRFLKLRLDEVSCKLHKPYYEQYKFILKEKRNASEAENSRLNEKLKQLDRDRVAVSVGLEHFIRELGQIYEAHIHVHIGDDKPKLVLSPSRKIPFENIPKLAANILLSGFPIELMDGDAGFVPEIWIADVMRLLSQELGSTTRVHIISVLGIQSSGKSTLLNTLFGLQFAVSAGRCTKGVFMQLVKIEKNLRSLFNVDYIVAVDTEGLRAALASTKFDNELSCFAIGLADLTIVNLMGENAKYLEENLPVVVHAFLRMEMVGLRPQCILVHQNVDKTNKDKLMEQNRLLENVLDDLTSRACEMEGVDPNKRFKDIIHFDVSDSAFYIPGLLEGDQPMGPVSLGYSQECNSLRNEILHRSGQSSRHLTINDFAKHLNDLWIAIKTDDFVFNFKSTAETQSSLQLEQQYAIICTSLLDEIQKIEEEAKELAKRSMGEQSHCRDNIIAELKQKISICGNEHKQLLTDYIEDPNKAYSKLCIQWKEVKLQLFDQELEDTKRESIEQVEKVFEKNETILRMTSVDEIDYIDKGKLEAFVKVKLSEVDITTKEENLTERIWMQWQAEVEREQMPKSDDDTLNIKGDVESIVLRLFNSEKRKLEKAHFQICASSDFELESFVIQDKHISKIGSFLDICHLKRSRVEAEKVVGIIMSNTKTAIEHIENTKKSYTLSRIRKILLQVKTMLEKQSRLFTKDLKIDIFIHIANYVYVSFSNLYKREKKVESETRIASRKLHIVALIKSMISEQIDETHNLCVEQVTEMVLKETVRKTITRIHRHINSLNIFRKLPKQECLDELLRRTLTDSDYILIELYITDPESAIIQMLVKYIQTEDLKRDAQYDLNRRIDIFMKELRRFELKENTTVYEFIVQTFRKGGLSVPGTYVKTLNTLNIDIPQLRDGILKAIEKTNKSELISRSNLCGEIEQCGKTIKQKAATHFVRNLGCFKTCPFCNEVCMYATTNHVQQHQSARHRPIGYANYVWKESKKIVSDVCSSLVRTNCVVHLDDGSFPFKHYTERYPKWKITGHVNEEASLLWKWYFAKHFQDKECKLVVPEAWESITKERVIRSLSLSGLSMRVTEV